MASVDRAISTASSFVRPLTFSCAMVRLRSTVMCGNRLNCWKTIPMRARSLSTSASGSVISSPSTKIFPLVGVSSMLTQRSRVDLPDPDGPITQTTCPCATWKSMPLSTSLAPKYLWRSWTSMAAVGAVGAAVVGRVGGHQRALSERLSMRRTTIDSGTVISR